MRRLHSSPGHTNIAPAAKWHMSACIMYIDLFCVGLSGLGNMRTCVFSAVVSKHCSLALSLTCMYGSSVAGAIGVYTDEDEDADDDEDADSPAQIDPSFLKQLSREGTSFVCIESLKDTDLLLLVSSLSSSS